MESKLSGLGKTVRGYMQGREGASPTNREREPIPRPAIAPADSDVILDFLPRRRNRYGIALRSGGWPEFLVNGPSAARTRVRAALDYCVVKLICNREKRTIEVVFLRYATAP
jgi:hypothetical protein